MSDVDGTLTDSGIYYSRSGEELKKFNMRDGMGFEILRKKKILTGLITSEYSKQVELRAKKLEIDYLFQGKKFESKLQTIEKLCESLNISIHEVAYIGDDINCYDLLSKVGVPGCPGDAIDEIKNIENICIMGKVGGNGAVREFINYLINNELLYN